MPENGSIDVLIKKTGSAEGTSPTQQWVGEQEVNKGEQGKLGYQTKAVNGAIIGQAKNAIAAGLNIYADITKDYRNVERLTNAVGVAGDVAIIATTGVAGGIYVAGKYAIQVGTSVVQQKNAELEHSVVLARAGHISESGSR